jgi:hypothetical protein
MNSTINVAAKVVAELTQIIESSATKGEGMQFIKARLGESL